MTKANLKSIPFTSSSLASINSTPEKTPHGETRAHLAYVLKLFTDDTTQRLFERLLAFDLPAEPVQSLMSMRMVIRVFPCGTCTITASQAISQNYESQASYRYAVSSVSAAVPAR
jgi:hypothetical protein